MSDELIKHPLFRVPYDKYIWYSERTYTTSEEELVELLDDFEKSRERYEASFQTNPEYFQKFVEVAHVIWRSYHLVAAKPLLQRIVQFMPEQAETYFYLAQISQDEIADFAHAISYYQKFIELEPNLVPDNNFFIDGWFVDRHAYAPSTLEALTNLGVIYQKHYQDFNTAKHYFARAIQLKPNHHLSPYLRLADLLKDTERNFKEVLRLYQKAETNYFNTKWKSCPNNSPCEYYPRLEAWAREKYPYYDGGIKTFVVKYEQLGKECYEQDYVMALECYGRANRLLNRFQESVHKKFLGGFQGREMDSLSLKKSLYLKQIELVFKHYRDYWQVELLCQKVLAIEPSNQIAQEYLDWLEEHSHLLGRLR
jgi:tetratricopeptide (TPR) repeat protein